MKRPCEYCGGDKRPRVAKFMVRDGENMRMSEKNACGYHLVTAVAEASKKLGFARVRPLPEER